jgi:curved DNA-binding protein CbpA
MIEPGVRAGREKPERRVVDGGDDADGCPRDRVYGGAAGSAGSFATLAGWTSEGATLPDPGLGDAYAILGVAPGSDDEAIAAAYRTLARRHHPDVAGESGTARMARLNAAYERIRTANRRAEYERARPSTDGPRSRWAPEFDGTGGAGRPPGRPSGSVLDFGRHLGWSIGEIARVDPGYLEWLETQPAGRPYVDEIDATLRAIGFRTSRPHANRRR